MIRSAVALLVAAVVACSTASAQDVHFTQFYGSPLLLNPALTGGFNGQLRASAQYRDQWRGVIESPFTTTSAALDFRFPLASSGRGGGDAAAAGIVFLNDRVRAFDYSFNQISASGAYHKMLDKATNSILSGGLQIGIGQRNISYSNLTFQDEFAINANGTSDFSGSTRELLPQNNIAYADVSVGINYSYAPRGRPAFYVGAAAHHINKPDISFYAEDVQDNLPAGTEPRSAAELDSRYTFHAASAIPLASTISLRPRVLVQAQGESIESVLGTNIRFQFDDFSSTALHVGTWGRGVRNDTGFGLDAIVALVGLEYNNFLLGTSYDVGTSDFTAGARGRGALEISLAYLGNYDNDTLLCPQF